MPPVQSILAFVVRAAHGLASRRRKPFRWAALACLLAVLHGCADLLGYGDYRFDTAGTGGTPGGAGGSGGVAGTGGTGGTGGALSTCATDADCAPSPFGQVCDQSTGQCVECLPGAEDTCAFGLYCDPGKVCFIGCAEDADCNPGGAAGPLACDPASHRCTGCASGGVCPPGSKCDPDGDACVPGCDTSPDCPTADWQCCSGQCKNVSKDVQHCGACDDTCDPDQSTTWLCLDGGCVFQSCNSGYADCDQNLAEGNGCEVSTQTDAASCGGCGEACDLANAGAICSRGQCEIGSCNAPFQNCDGVGANGCETNLDTSAASCGGCMQSCAGVFPASVPTCQAGQCVFGGCLTGFGDCNGVPEDGCEVELGDNPQHCGGCGEPCQVPHASPLCVAGQCEIDQCDDGFADCTPDAGCETNLGTDANHCAMCGKSCDNFPNANGVCNGGDCQLGPCKAGFADCDGFAGNGCETSVTTTNNCGACGNVCGVQGASAVACNAGTCQITCDSTHGDCDGLPSNGCETDVTSSAKHCGTCGNQCPANGGTPNCVGSTCGVSNCPPSLADCDADGSCETAINLPTSCGACGNVCNTTHATQVACAGAPLACLPTCESGWANCNDNPADGCEQPLNTNQHCTACGTPCQLPNALTSCASGACQIVGCQPGFANCNGVAADGCEANLLTSAQHCGVCNQPCAPANGNGQCTAGACSIQSCDAGYLDCNGSPNDGCEIDKTADPANCGSCGNTCSFANAQGQCAFPGVCQIGLCNANFNNCDGVDANGCEANTQTSTLHCGACNNPCASIHGAASCSSGACSINCNGGYDNCNGAFIDGCETSLHTLQDCGACDVPCDLINAVESCATGTCQITACAPGYTNCDQSASNGCECGSSCAAGTCQGCGDLICSPPQGEDCLTCPSDCGPCGSSSSSSSSSSSGTGGFGGG